MKMASEGIGEGGFSTDTAEQRREILRKVGGGIANRTSKLRMAKEGRTLWGEGDGPTDWKTMNLGITAVVQKDKRKVVVGEKNGEKAGRRPPLYGTPLVR